ncbi:MAG: energy-coupling factor transporter transmembrane component T [Clostridia bacterium]|jgi:energy-coupling factor transport system permease protein
MLENITIGQYVPGTTFLYRADPRIKIILTVFFMISIFLIRNYFYLAVLIVFILTVIVVSDIPLNYILRTLKPILFIIIFTAVLNIFFTKGTSLFRFGYINITYEGIDSTVRMVMTLSLLMIGASILTLTTTPILLTDGIEKLMTPASKIGIPSHEIAMMMTIALRFIPTLLEETGKIIKAQSSRGADFDSGNIIKRAKSFVPVLVPLFISAFRRADELANAMESRCYRGSEGRTRMKQLKLGMIDFWISLSLIVFIAGLLYLQSIRFLGF